MSGKKEGGEEGGGKQERKRERKRGRLGRVKRHFYNFLKVSFSSFSCGESQAV